jgi:hypothetical protein
MLSAISSRASRLTSAIPRLLEEVGEILRRTDGALPASRGEPPREPVPERGVVQTDLRTVRVRALDAGNAGSRGI